MQECVISVKKSFGANQTLKNIVLPPVQKKPQKRDKEKMNSYVLVAKTLVADAIGVGISPL